jgi:hypothetical protein
MSDVEIQRRLKQVETHLTSEFSDLADWLVRLEARTAAAQLLARARFTDFVPLLAYRIARERLRDHRAGRLDESAGVTARSA